MFYHEYPPPEILKNYIQCFWMLEHDYRDKTHSHEHLWADTHSELIFSYGQPYYQEVGSGRINLPQSFVIGPFKKELLLYSEGLTGFIAVRFHPWGLSRFSTKKMTELINQVLPVHALMDPSIVTLEQQLAGKTKEEKLALLTAWFTGRQGKPADKETGIQRLAEAIKEKKGVIKIADLVNSSRLNPRKIERLFISEIGMSAKLFARILRFNHAKQLIERNPDISLASLTYETGYSDQAHFSKNFREMFNYTPAAFKLRMKRFSQNPGDSERDVVFLQDN
jgi:AraC-like DNA-binding protein